MSSSICIREGDYILDQNWIEGEIGVVISVYNNGQEVVIKWLIHPYKRLADRLTYHSMDSFSDGKLKRLTRKEFFMEML